MFQLNKKSIIVQYLTKFDFELSKLLIRNELEQQDIELLTPVQEEVLGLISLGKYNEAEKMLKEAV